jgi:hypothetical protein
MTADTREFPIEVIASLTTGILLCPFGKLHEAAEFLMGHPIWTHHFTSLAETMKHKALEQHPGLPTSMAGVTRDNYQQHVAGLILTHGPTIAIRKGGGQTAMHSLDGIPKGKPVLIVRRGEGET